MDERVEKFDKEHGNDYILIDGWLLFSDGAVREVRAGLMRKPPVDPYQAAKLIVRYWQAKLNLAEDEFRILKGNLLIRVNDNLQRGYDSPGPEAIAKLEGLQKKVRGLQVRLQQAEDHLENSKSDDMLRQEKLAVDALQSCADFTAAVKKIEV